MSKAPAPTAPAGAPATSAAAVAVAIASASAALVPSLVVVARVDSRSRASRSSALSVVRG
jgi:hypothetical protein